MNEEYNVNSNFGLTPTSIESPSNDDKQNEKI